MHPIGKAIAASIGEHSLLPHPAMCRRPVIVAFSGGADSVTLLHALHSLGYTCIAAHCNFHLRGDESDRDQRFCTTFAESLGIPLEIAHFDIGTYRRDSRISVEMACRETRYRWFDTLMSRHNAIALAVGHHRDDNVETVMLNMLRASGVRGLSGMRPRNGNIIRPMLSLTRSDIEGYVRDCGLEYVTDSTNRENEFRRNRLRNIILPQLRGTFPGSDEAIDASARHCRMASDFIDHAIAGKRLLYISASGDIDIASLVSNEGDDAAFVLYEMLSGSITIEAARTITATPQASGRIYTAGDRKMLLDRGILTPYQPETVEPRTIDADSPHFTWQLISDHPFDRSMVSDMTIALDASVMKGNPRFELRGWREGDRLAPFGMKGSRLLSDIFSDAKLSLLQKKQVRVLTRNGTILWVIGLRASRHFPVTSSSQAYYLLTFNPPIS